MARTAAWIALGFLGLVAADHAHAQGVVMQRNLSLTLARTIAEGALAECQGKGFHTSVAVVDRSGQPLVILRDEQAGPHTLEMSRRKAYTAHTRTSASDIMADIRKVRAQGFAISNQEYILHISGAAVPVLNHEKKLVAALSVAALSVRTSSQQLRQLIPTLQDAATALAASLAQVSDRDSGSRRVPRSQPTIRPRSTRRAPPKPGADRRRRAGARRE